MVHISSGGFAPPWSHLWTTPTTARCCSSPNHKAGFVPLYLETSLPLAWLGPHGALCCCHSCYGFKGSHSDWPVNDVDRGPLVCQGFCVCPWSQEVLGRSAQERKAERFFFFFQSFFLLVLRESFCLSQRKIWICGRRTPCVQQQTWLSCAPLGSGHVANCNGTQVSGHLVYLLPSPKIITDILWSLFSYLRNWSHWPWFLTGCSLSLKSFVLLN